MKLLAISDLHLDWVTQGVPRFDELKSSLLDHVLPAAVKNEVDALFFLGDLTDPDSGPVIFRAVELAIYMAKFLEKAGIASVWMPGNHDVIEDGTGTTTLSPMKSIRSDWIYVSENPSKFTIPTRGSPDGLTVVTFPFVPTSRPYDPEEWATKALAGTKDAITLSHLSVPGVIPGEETTEMPRGREIMFPTEIVAPRAKLMVQGHYHRQQRTESGIWIVGSLARLTFGEAAHTPGFLLIETE